jgi:hypothetical protein
VVVVVVGGTVVGGDVVVVARLPPGPDRTAADDDEFRAALRLLGPFVEHDAKTATSVIATRDSRRRPGRRLWSDLLMAESVTLDRPYPLLWFATELTVRPRAHRKVLTPITSLSTDGRGGLNQPSKGLKNDS